MDGDFGTERLYVRRYNGFQRVNHWLTAILFILLSLSGLSLFYPSLFWLATIFGGLQGARELHPWFGCALMLSFFVLAVQFVVRNIPNIDDVRWAAKIVTVMTNHHEGLPDLGKYNAGQKGVYWGQVAIIPVLFVTGLAVWETMFGDLVPIEWQRIALLVHSFLAVIAMTIIIVHIYAGIWIKGTGRAMVRGSVTGGWAYVHHRKWLREAASKGLVERKPTLHGDA